MRVLVGALALWLTTLIVGGSGDHGVWIVSYDTGAVPEILTLLLVALIFGIVNATLGRVVKFVSIPLYILTLGLIGLIINGLLMIFVGWISGLIGFGLVVDGFWWGVLGAIVLSILSSILNAFFGTKKKPGRR